MLTLAISSCDEDTVDMGTSVTSSVDQFAVLADTFDVSTRSIIADSILSRSSYSYLGRLKDPETGTYISSDFMTQFAILENEANNIFATKDNLLSLDDNGLPIADSCHVNIVINSYMGDSLTAMKVKMTEMAKPMKENELYYTNFDPEAKGYLRDDGIIKNKLYSIHDLMLSDSTRLKRSSANYYEYIDIPLNESYTDQKGNTYNNYGTYLMRSYYDHPEYFKNSAAFIQNVCPGLYFQTTDGLGLMSQVSHTQLVVYFRQKKDTVNISSSKVFNGTEEVLQTTHFTNDRKHIEELAAKEEYTYLKSPDGIFTEVTLPVDDIKLNHENDTIASAKIVFRRLNDSNDISEYVLVEPDNLLMVPRDSLYTFFEQRNVTDNITSYLASYNSRKNTYTFNNISSLINRMYANRNKSVNWNKVVLVPVQVTTTNTSTSSGSVTKVATINNELKVMSIRLVGGKRNQHDPVRISIIYNKSN